MKHLIRNLKHFRHPLRVVVTLAIIFLLTSYESQSQSLILKIKEATGITLCRNSATELIIHNTSNTRLSDLPVVLYLPEGMNYLPGTVSGALESNLQQLNQPAFILKSLNAHDSATIRLEFMATCQLYDEGNMAMTFANKWVVHFGTTADSIISFPEYQLLTPLLLIHKINDTTVLPGTSFSRKISITNTRLGSLRQFTYEDRHDHLNITSPSGTILEINDTILKLGFNASDFIKIGNRDSLFDKDETIEILEQIISPDCRLQQIRSDYRAYWGCAGDTCKIKQEYNVTTFKRENEAAKLLFLTEKNFPTCICDDKGTPQCLIIRNNGNHIAENIVITLKATDLLNMNPYGFVHGSVRVTGAAHILDTQYLYRLSLNSCTSDQLYAHCIVRLSELAPGEEVKINFNYTTCLVCSPNLGNLSWYYGYSYNSKCVPDIIESSAVDTKVNMINPGNTMIVKSSFKDSVALLEENKTYTIQNRIRFSKKITNQVLLINYTIPCPLRLKDTLFLLNGVAPIRKIIVDQDSTILVSLEYAPPFNDSVLVEYPIIVDCNYLCGLNLNTLGNVFFVTDCPNKQQLLTSIAGLICIDVKLSCPNRVFDCGPCARSQTGFELKCNIPARRDSIHAYIKGTAQSFRLNYGGSDPDDDRIVNPGTLDTSLTNRKKLITGDWITHEYNSTIVAKNNRYMYDSIALMVSSSPEIFYDSIITEFIIKDISTGITYTVMYPIFSLYKSSNGIPNCSRIVLTRTGFGNGIIIPATVQLLNLFGANLPSNFQFENGDSLTAKIRGRISSYTVDRIVPIVFTYRAFFINRDDIKPDPFSCMIDTDTIILATQGISFSQSQDTIFLCKSSIELSQAVIRGTSSLKNYFNKEFRNHFSLDSIKISLTPFNPYLIIDSIRIEYFYEQDSLERIIHSQNYPVRLNNNRWEIDPDFIKQHRYDESYAIRIIPTAHIDDCEKFKTIKGNLITVYYINSKNNSVFYDINNSNEIINRMYYSSANTLSIFNGTDYLNILDKTINSTSSKIQWTSLISNLKINGGFEFEFIIKNNSIKNIVIQPIPGITISQPDSMHLIVENLRKNQNYLLQFSAEHTFCYRDTIQIIIRWFCQGDSTKLIDNCNLDTFNLVIIPEYPELELFVDTLSKTEFVLCDTLPELLLEIYNADRGAAFDVFLEVFIPAGAEMIPSSLKYSYPKGSPFQQLPFPFSLGMGKYRWNFSELIPEIKLNGLPGIKLPPDSSNVIQIKMNLITFCKAAINSYPRFFISGKSQCGEPTNSILKPGPLIRIKGVTNPGTFNLSILNPDLKDCAEETSLRISLHKNGISNLSDSLKLNLPPGLFYIPNSLKVIKNADNRDPVLITENGVQTLYFGILPNLNPADSIIFTIRIGGLFSILCTQQTVQAFTYTRNTTYCSATGENCDVFVESGSAEIIIDQKTGSLSLDSFSLSPHADSVNFNLNFNYFIKDIHLIKEDNICLALYEDLNKNGILNLSDKLLDTLIIRRDQIPADGLYSFYKKISQTIVQSCHYLLASLPKNCLCKTDTLSFSFHRTRQFYYSDSLCLGDSIYIGTTKTEGKSYQWIKGKTDCDTCHFILIHFRDSLFQDSLYQYTLSETDSSGCDVHYNFTMRLSPSTHGEFTYLESCPGELIRINAGTRQHFIWKGDSISNPLLYQQQFINYQDKTLYLSFKDQYNCPAEDTFFIHTLIDTSHIELNGDSIVALGSPVIYCIKGGKSFLWSPSSGIDCIDCRCVTIVPNESTTYFVTVLDSFDCPHVFQFSIIVVLPSCDSSNVFLPNAFSPNADGKNDILFVRGFNVERMHLGIYNRWGQKVFESFDQQNGWDGTFKGSLLAPDVFGYHLEVDCIGGKKYFKKGNISLIK